MEVNEQSMMLSNALFDHEHHFYDGLWEYDELEINDELEFNDDCDVNFTDFSLEDSSLFNLDDNKILYKVSRNSVCSGAMWPKDVEESIKQLQTMTELISCDESWFSTEGNFGNIRYTVKSKVLPYLTIFPWFRGDRRVRRYRETLGKRHGISEVVEAVNYFLCHMYTDGELQLIRNYYMRQLSSRLLHCLTSIIDARNEISKIINPKLKDANQKVYFLKFPNTNEAMPPCEWKIAIKFALEILQNNTAIEPFTRDIFFRTDHRYNLTARALKFFKVFPWFHSIKRLRFIVLKGSEIFLDEVVRAANYFFRKPGKDYTTLEIQSLQKYYELMDIPSPKKSLSAVIDAYKTFVRDRETTLIQQNLVNQNFEELIFGSDECSSSRLHGFDICVEDNRRMLSNLNARVEIIENYLKIQDGSDQRKKPRHGGDRACWYPIREADYSTRETWCVPGAVMGLYTDGVGRLLPVHVSFRRSVVVYSVDPDVVEEHPDPDNAERYVRVVMVTKICLIYANCCRWAKLRSV